MHIAKLYALALTPFLLQGAMPNKTQTQPSTDNPVCQSPFHVMHADVRHTESKGVGYNKGYTTLEWFGIYQNNPNFMPFLDLRGHVFNDGMLAGNVGLGERTMMTSINHLFGLYLYYDVRQEHHGLTVNQLSPGLEILGKRMEYRMNAYFPLGDTESRSYYHKFRRFDGNRMMIKSRKKFAMTGADAEVGAHITQSTNHDFYFGVGPYYFTDDPSTAWGGKGRLFYRYKEYVTLEASYSYDHLFKNVVQGSVAFSYPFGKKLSRKGKNCPNGNDLALSRAAFAPYRFEIPVVETHHRSKAAKSSVTRRPLNVWFVRNTSSSDGTFESPFPTLAQAQAAAGPNDLIYVFPGDGTTKGMNAGITLKDGQMLFGSATPQHVRTTVGRITIPAQSSVMPTITNSASVIQVANGNEISGMNIVAGGNAGITNVNPIVGINIHNNIISNSVSLANANGVQLTGAAGNINVTRNVIVGPTTGLLDVGVNLQATNGSTGRANISNNTFIGHGVGTIFSVVGSDPRTGNWNVTFSGNQLSDFVVVGIAVVEGVQNGIFNITNNRLLDTLSILNNGAISVAHTVAQPNFGSFNISGNTVIATTTSAATGIRIVPSAVTANARFSIQNNNLTVSPNAGSYGLNMNAGASSVFCATIINNTVTKPLAASTGMSISGLTGTVNIDSFSNNVASTVLFSGNVNLVAPGSCGP